MRRPGWFCLALVLLATVSAISVPAAQRGAPETAFVAEQDTTVTDKNGPDNAGPGTTEQAGTEPSSAVGQETELSETEPLAPIETQSSIRVNANVSLPQDI